MLVRGADPQDQRLVVVLADYLKEYRSLAREVLCHSLCVCVAVGGGGREGGREGGGREGAGIERFKTTCPKHFYLHVHVL